MVYNPPTPNFFQNWEQPAVQAFANDVTLLLNAWRGGDSSALDRLIPLVYDELRRIAHRQMSHERQGHTLQSNVLVNEAYLRLIDTKDVQWQNRAHFFFFAAQLMRRILVDHARARCRLKRGGHSHKVPLDPSLAIPSGPDANLARLDDALNALKQVDERKSKVVELRYFGGFSVEETAEALGISERTVMNDWKFAKVWLLRELEGKG
jgi:RNA polymerase sigma-70 factor (ECF subfamily)